MVHKNYDVQAFCYTSIRLKAR